MSPTKRRGVSAGKAARRVWRGEQQPWRSPMAWGTVEATVM
jgi:hypothetical protein